MLSYSTKIRCGFLQESSGAMQVTPADVDEASRHIYRRFPVAAPYACNRNVRTEEPVDDGPTASAAGSSMDVTGIFDINSCSSPESANPSEVPELRRSGAKMMVEASPDDEA